jgi:hypothetical protein
VALAPEHPLAGKKFLRAEDLRKEHVLVYDSRQESNLLRVLIPAGVRPEQMSIGIPFFRPLNFGIRSAKIRTSTNY